MSSKKLFTGKDTKSEERAEAKALKSGKITKAQYIAGEKREERKEGEKKPVGAIRKNAEAIKSGKMSPTQYAKKECK
jgi:hypothetical protein